MAESKEYISLKEAARLSGYSSDYIGQLIRAGKLHGKQVYLNVAWVTTKEALEEYTSKDKKNAGIIPENLVAYFRQRTLTLESLSAMYSKLVWVAIAILILFVLFLFGVLSVSFDHRIEQKYMDKLQHDK